MASTKFVCEINRYLHHRPGRNSWWFRRRVPVELISAVGQREWRYTLKARNRADAVAEAIPYLIRTNDIIELARRGEWPPLDPEGAEEIAHRWAVWTPQDSRDGDIGGEPVFENEAAFTASLTKYMATHWRQIKPGGKHFEIVKGFARGECRIESPRRDAATATETTLKCRIVVIFDPDPENEHDLIAEWASWRKKPDKTKYQVRAMMRRLVEITKINDLNLLKREHIEEWIKHLREFSKNKSGKSLSEVTIAANLDLLRILCNFAIEKEWLVENPTAKIKVIKKGKNKRKRRSYTDAEARMVLEWARRQRTPYLRWLPWVCCFTGCRLDEVAGATVKDIEKVGPYWVLNVRLDHRPDDASLKTDESERRVPLHPALVAEGFVSYVETLRRRGGSLFPELRPDRFGSKGGTATKRIGPRIRELGKIMPSLADPRLSPSHSWRHRLHDEFRRLMERTDIEDAIIGHATEGSGTGYGEYAITDMLGPAIERTRSPFDVRA